MPAGRLMRLDVGTAERDDLFLQFHAHTTKRGFACVCPARLDRRLKPECILEPGKYSLYRVTTAGNRAVDTLTGDEDRTEQAVFVT